MLTEIIMQLDEECLEYLIHPVLPSDNFGLASHIRGHYLVKQSLFQSRDYQSAHLASVFLPLNNMVEQLFYLLCDILLQGYLRV